MEIRQERKQVITKKRTNCKIAKWDKSRGSYTWSYLCSVMVCCQSAVLNALAQCCTLGGALRVVLHVRTVVLWDLNTSHIIYRDGHTHRIRQYLVSKARVAESKEGLVEDSVRVRKRCGVHLELCDGAATWVSPV